MADAGGMHRMIMVAQDPLQPLEALGASRDFLSHTVGTIKRKRRSRNDDDGFDFHQGAPDSVQSEVERRGGTVDRQFKGRSEHQVACHLRCGRTALRHLSDAREASDYKGADVLLRRLPEGVEWFLADGGYDGNWVRKLLKSMGITPVIPGRSSRKKTIRYNKKLYKQRNRIERAFAKLRDWRRIDHRYDRCPEIFLSACAFAAIVIWWV